jgi:ribosomal protein S8
MKKGTQIMKVTINNNLIKAFDDKMRPIPLTRTQRTLLTQYKQTGYIESISKEWHNNNVIHDNFTVEKDGTVVYTYTK